MKTERALREIRMKIFSYPDDKAEKADRVLRYLIRRKVRNAKPSPKGPYSGLTRAEMPSWLTEADFY